MRTIVFIVASLLGWAWVWQAAQAQTGPDAGLNRLGAVSMDWTDGLVTITITASKEPIFTSYLLSGPERLVIDFPRTCLEPELEAPPGRNDLVRRIVLETPRELERTVRLVIYLTQAVDFTIARQSRMLVLKLEQLPGGVPVAWRREAAGRAERQGGEGLEIERLEKERRRQEEAERKRLEEERLRQEGSERQRLEKESRQQEESERKRLEEERLRQEESERQRLEEERLRQEESERKRLEEERRREEEAERRRLEEERRRQEMERKRLEEEREQEELEEQKRQREEAIRRAEEERRRREGARRREEEQRRRMEEIRRREERERLEREERQAAARRSQAEAERRKRLPLKKLRARPLKPARLKVVGFHAEGSNPRISVDFDSEVEVRHEWLGDRMLRFTFYPARITNKVNTLPLQTSVFGTPIQLIRPDWSPREKTVHLRVELSRKVPFMVHKSANRIDLIFHSDEILE